MKFLAGLIIIVVCMALRDTIYTALTIYQSHGKARKAGLADGLGDVVSMIYMWVGIDALNALGFSLKGVVLMLSVGLTSYKTTMWATKWVTDHES